MPRVIDCPTEERMELARHGLNCEPAEKVVQDREG